MECVVCFAGVPSRSARSCGTPGCGGAGAVCDSCYERVDKCVFCRRPRSVTGGLESSPETDFARLYYALCYAQVVCYMMGQTVFGWESGDENHPAPESVSASESVSSSLGSPPASIPGLFAGGAAHS